MCPPIVVVAFCQTRGARYIALHILPPFHILMRLNTLSGTNNGDQNGNTNSNGLANGNGVVPLLTWIAAGCNAMHTDPAVLLEFMSSDDSSSSLNLGTWSLRAGCHASHVPSSAVCTRTMRAPIQACSVHHGCLAISDDKHVLCREWEPEWRRQRKRTGLPQQPGQQYRKIHPSATSCH